MDYKGKIIYITDRNIGEGASITVSTSTAVLDEQLDDKTFRAYGIRIRNTTVPDIYTNRLYYTGDTYPYSYIEGGWGSKEVPSNFKIIFHNIRAIHIVDDTDYNRGITNLDKLDALPEMVINAGTVPAVSTTAYRNFDNSNSRLSKIIELPYCPVKVSKNADGTYSFTDCTFNYGYNIMQINTEQLTNPIAKDTRIQDLLYVNYSKIPTGTDAPNIELESKLYSSEFYDYAYYYDTDKQPIRLEDISVVLTNCAISITYNTTSTMNSDKQFYFDIYNGAYKRYQPYELYMNCGRSTEKMIYNDSYAEYIKNGYNYDSWNKKRQEKIATTNAVIGGIQSVVGIGLGVSGAVGSWKAGTVAIANAKDAEGTSYAT